MSARRPRAALAVVAAFVVAIATALPAVASESGRPFDARAWLRDLAGATLGNLLAALPTGSPDVHVGSDGRVTFLLLGSDIRPGYPENLDVIIVASLDPQAHRVAMAAIPRDTVHFPRAASNGGGTSGNLRVNAMYRAYRSGWCGTVCALGRFRNDVEVALGIDIDHYAYIRFAGFDALIDHVDGIRVDTPGRIVDKTYMDEPTLPRGIKFPWAANYELRGETAPNCRSWKPSAANCHRAIVYVRSRHGREGGHSNNDYRRSYRQQRVVMAAVKRVIGRGPGNLGALVNAVDSRITSDLSATLANAQWLYAGLVNSRLKGSVVFAPSTWAYRTSGMPTYTYRLRLGKVRAWVDQKMPPT